MNWFAVIVAIIGIPLFLFIMYNFRRQKDFEGTGHPPPEEYD